MKKLALLALGVFITACGETPTEAPTEMDVPPVAMNETSEAAMHNRCYGAIIAATWTYAADRESFPPPPGALAKWIDLFLAGEATARDVQQLFCD